MAKVETETSANIVITKNEVTEMYQSLQGKKDFWIRVCIETCCMECRSQEMSIYLQGPDGEEEELLHTILD